MATFAAVVNAVRLVADVVDGRIDLSTLVALLVLLLTGWISWCSRFTAPTPFRAAVVLAPRTMALVGADLCALTGSSASGKCA